MQVYYIQQFILVKINVTEISRIDINNLISIEKKKINIVDFFKKVTLILCIYSYWPDQIDLIVKGS